MNDQTYIEGCGQVPERCKNLIIKGVATGTKVEVEQLLDIDGTLTLKSISAEEIQGKGTIIAESITCNNQIKFEGTIETENGNFGNAEIHGSSKIKAVVTKEGLQISGLITSETIDATNLYVTGGINAQSVEAANFTFSIDSKDSFLVKNIKSDNLCVCAKNPQGKMKSEMIEGKTLELENTSATLVIADKITVGKGCMIDEVRYRDSISIDPQATVKMSVEI